ncbi:MAG: hypothetical protein K0M69_03005, partial [Youngiibacter sp.]|nr:hypothetical protein [Youngiibacter sp.]
ISSYTGSLKKPDVTLLGTISNIGVSPRFGEVLITSTGSVYVRSDINAGTLSISASASMVQSYQDTFISVGGEVRVHYSSMATRQQNNTNLLLSLIQIPLRYPDSYDNILFPAEKAAMNSLLAGILSVTNRQDAKLSELRAANIFIAARYLNVNGLIEAGHATQSAYLAGSIDTKIQTYKNRGLLSRNYLDYPLVQISDMKFYYDPVNDRILLDDVSVRGGYVELFGQIISTGTGRIKALDGFGTISVVNETLYSLAIKALDVGIGSHGTIKITDTSKQTKIGDITYYQITKYTRAYDTGTGKYTITVKTWWSNTSEDAATTVVTNIADASVTNYQPTVGYRYVYVLGQDSGIKETYTYATSSWAGIDWLAKDPGSLYSYVYQTYGTPVPLENGEYLAYVPESSSIPYMYWYQSITQSERILVSQRQWTTSGGFLGLKKTYWTEAIYRTYVKNVHYHSIKADYPIAIEFAGGLAGNISIVSDKDIVIMGPVTNVLGKTTLDTDGRILQTSSTSITSKDIELLAGTGIGNGQPIYIELKGGSLKAVTDEGDISILEISGTLKITEVSTGDGKVWLTAQTGIVAASSETLVKGDFISLYAGTGGIGSAAALRVDTGTGAGSGMIAKAEGSITLKEIDGDMNILSIVSTSGSVSIEAVSGSLTDGDETERQSDNEGVLVVLRDNVTAGNLMDQWTSAGIAASSDSKYTPNQISTLLAYALHKRLTDTEYRYELVNVSGLDITLKATGGIGNLRAARIDFTDGKALLTEETMLMLAAAERGDIRFYDVDDIEVTSGSTSTAYIIITIHDDLDITSTGKLTVIAGADSYIGSEEDVRIMTMTGQDTRIRSAKGIQSALTAAGQNIVCGSLVIEAGNGAIGTEAKPIGVTAVSAGTERLAARSNGGIWLRGIASGADTGSFNLDFIYTPGAISINADGWIKDSTGDGFEKIVGESLLINADSVGIAGGTLETDLLVGNMEIHATSGGIYVEELEGDINALVIGTSTGDVILKAKGSILDAQTEGETKPSNILGRNINLTATNGSIGTAGNHLEIDSANGGAGKLDADAKLDMFIDELTLSLSLGKLISHGSRIFISAPGAIVNAIGLTSGYNVEGLSLSFAAGLAAGTEAAPILMKVSELAGDAAGDVWIINDGALTVKVIADGKSGIDADGKVQITVRSPFTLESYIYSGGDTIIRTNDSASGDGITIAALAEIDSEGRVVLLSGDDIHILKTSIIEAVGEVVLFGDFNGAGYEAISYSYTGDPDKGTGATIEILELPAAPSISAYGGDDNDSFILTVDEASGVISMHGKGGSDSFLINRLPSLTSTFSGQQDTLTLDGESGADTYTININNGQDVHNIINVRDTGTDLGDSLYVNG